MRRVIATRNLLLAGALAVICLAVLGVLITWDIKKNTAYIFIAVILSILLLAVTFAAIYIHNISLKNRLKKEQTLTRNAIDAANILILEIDANDKIREFNIYAENRTGYSSWDVINRMPIFELVAEESIEDVHRYIDGARLGIYTRNYMFPLKCYNGEKVDILWNIDSDEHDIAEKHIRLMGVDISDRLRWEKELQESHDQMAVLCQELTSSEEELRSQLEELLSSQEKLNISEERYKLSAEGSNDIIWIIDFVEGTVNFSDRWYDMLQYSREKVKPMLDIKAKLIYPDDRNQVVEAFYRHVTEKSQFFECEFRLKMGNGEYKWVYARGKALLDQSERYVRMAGSITDINDRKLREQRMSELAYFDVLTGLPNRLRVSEIVDAKLGREIKNGAFLYIDADNFKFINDSFGHIIGDNMLIEVGRRIMSVSEEDTLVGRLGGDEFCVLLPQIKNRNEVELYCEKLICSMNDSFTIDGMDLHITISIGIAVYPDDGENFDELMRNADTVMFKVKESGKKSYIFYKRDMNEKLRKKITMESYLRKAIYNDELMLYYQPQIQLLSGDIYGFEALLRWVSPVYGFVPPGEFISIAEETGIITSIGEWVLEKACLFNKKLHDMGHNMLRISVNLSVIQLLQDDFVEMVVRILDKTGLPAEFLEIEITETVLMESIESNLRKLESLRDIGVKVSLDDFGKGYSSLNYLKQLPINTLKIDKSFIDDIGKSRDMSDSIILLAHKMGLSVVAEGVETDEQLRHLHKNGCNMIQGYLISAPVPEADAIKLLKKE